MATVVGAVGDGRRAGGDGYIDGVGDGGGSSGCNGSKAGNDSE